MTLWPYPRVLAHRCGGALAPENTLAGLPVAARFACGGVEFDVMLSADGVPVLIHDETLDRTTTGQGRVCDASAAQLAALDAGCRFHPAFAGTRIPTLADALAGCARLGLSANVEIKPAAGFEAETGIAVARMAAASSGSLPAEPLLSSFSEEALRAARLEAPLQPSAILFEGLPADWQARCEALGVIAVHADASLLTESEARAITAAGYQLAVYTVNKPAQADMLRKWGAACIITDRPDRVF